MTGRELPRGSARPIFGLMKYLLTLFALLFAPVIAPAALAKSDPIYTGWRDNNAVGGYDVTTFYDGVPQKGKREHAVIYNGARWMFVTQSKLAAFKEAPQKYAPAYGGYCAWAAANDKLAKGNPKYWNIEDGRLYLNFNRRIQTRWNKDKPGFIKAADENWPQILAE